MTNILNVSFCKAVAGQRIMGLFGILLSTIKIIIPIILIVIGTIELTKCMMAQKQDEIKNKIKKLVIKCIYAIVIFFIPTIIGFIMNVVGVSNDNECILCLLNNPASCVKATKTQKKSSPNSLCSIYNNSPESCVGSCEYADGYCQRSD